jgi:L-asparaginase/Glu-tRNA(Gln) amidotransferase subunit D
MTEKHVFHEAHKDSQATSEENSPLTQMLSRELHMEKYRFEEPSVQCHSSIPSHSHQLWLNNQLLHIPKSSSHSLQPPHSGPQISSIIPSISENPNSYSSHDRSPLTISTSCPYQSYHHSERPSDLTNRSFYQKYRSDQISKFIHTSPSPPRILILYVGGTIGMKPSPSGYLPEPNYLEHLLKSMPQFHDPKIPSDPLHLVLPRSEYGKQVHYAIKEYSSLCDSSNMTMKDWVVIAKDIQTHYDAYDGFVILHGTDTMTYTCSALSFILEHLDKSVIVTGAQVPISEARNDAQSNLLIALTIAGHFRIPEVSLYFNHKLMRGNRSIKLNALDFDAFHSPNFPPLIKVGVKMDICWSAIEELDRLQKEYFPLCISCNEKIHAHQDGTHHESILCSEGGNREKVLPYQKWVPDPDQSPPSSGIHQENSSFLGPTNAASPSNFVDPTPHSAPITISISHPIAATTPTTTTRLHVHTRMNPNVGILRLFTGITEHTVKAFLQEPTAGVVLCTYGTGNAPDNQAELLEAFHQACQRGVIIVNCTQCIYGSINVMYPSARMLQRIGIISGADMTIECAIAKLSYLLGKGYSTEKVRLLMATNLRGEMTLPSE